jgi:SH3-like domain-containing protein
VFTAANFTQFLRKLPLGSAKSIEANAIAAHRVAEIVVTIDGCEDALCHAKAQGNEARMKSAEIGLINRKGNCALAAIDDAAARF